MRPIHSTLFCFNSKRDRAGNCYWALRFVDHATGRDVVGTVTGGESNINAIRLHWTKPGEWDAGIQVVRIEKPIREFDALVKGWPHAGCDAADVAAFIRRGLAEATA